MSKYDNVGEILLELSEESEKGIVFIDLQEKDTFESYGSLCKEALLTLHKLQEKGLKPGDKLIFQIDNNKLFLTAFWACITGGIIPVPLPLSENNEQMQRLQKVWNSLERPHILAEHSNKLTDSMKKVETEGSETYESINKCKIILDSDIQSSEIGLAYPAKPDDIALIQFSSGSTGEPKGVVLTHSNIISNVTSMIAALKLTANDSCLSWLPLTHDMGLIGTHLIPVFINLNQFVMKTVDFIQQPVQWLVKVQEYKATYTAGPNFSLMHFLNHFKAEAAENWDLSCLNTILNGSEPISAELSNKFLSVMAKYKLKSSAMLPVYGLAEAGLAVTFPTVGKGLSSITVDRSLINIGSKIRKIDDPQNANSITFVDLGYPLSCINLRICSDNNDILTDSEVGHIQIKGTSVTSGYYNNRAETEKIITDDGWLDTGDLGFVSEGRLYITGRAKDVIFVNGQNYYAYDMERVILGYMKGTVEEVAACGLYDNKTEKETIIIFVKYKGIIDIFIEISKLIRKFLKAKMGLDADYIIPVNSIPKTESNKIQRFRLLEQYQQGMMDKEINEMRRLEQPIEEIKEESVAHYSLEEKILDIYRTMLNNTEIGVDDDLFEVGGSSITMMQIAAQISSAVGKNVSFRSLYEYSTAAKLAEHLKKSDNELSNTSYQIYEPDKKNAYEAFRLTDIQKAYLMGRNENFELGGISTHFYAEFETALYIAKLNKSLNKLIKRHPMLRTIFLPDGQQIVLPDVPEYEIKDVDITSMNKSEQEDFLKKERDIWSHNVFDASKWPLFDFHSYKTDEGKNLLCISMDMLIADGASIQIIVRDLIEFYENPDMEKAETEFTFRDYIMAYIELKNSEQYFKDRNYWMSKLDSFPVTPALPLKKEVSAVKRPYYRRLRKTIDSCLWKKIKDRAKEKGITPSALLCTAYTQVLSWWSNQSELAVSLTAFNRYPFHPQVNDIVGDFTSVLPLGVGFKPGTSFWEKAGNLQDVLFEAIEHMHYDGVEFLREISKKNNMESKLISPVVFTSMLFDNKLAAWDKLGVMRESISQTSQVYLDSQVMELSNELLLTWDYVEELFNGEEIGHMFEQYTGIIESIATDSIYEPKLMDSHRKVIENYNLTEEDIVPKTLQEMFEAQVSKTPFYTAVIFENESITYADLNKKANRIARYLKDKGIGENKCVGIHAVRCINTIANILGTLKTGAAYVPVDPSIPEERKKYILENSGCTLLLTPEAYLSENIESYSCNYIEMPDNRDSLAYIIYTSGSTGRPKGAMINHKAVSNTIIDINRRFDISEKDRIIGISSICFDLSVYDIFGALSTGATLVMVRDQRDVDNIREVMNRHNITFWNTVPAIMGMLLDNIDDEYENAALRNVLMSGDWIPVNMPERIWKHFKNAKVTSLGGATEASIWSIYYPIEKINAQWKSIPYGYPLANQAYYVLNYQMELCPVGVPGELYIGGVGVASGYINDPEKTKNAFITHPEFGYIYKTGDYGVLHEEGYIEFLGRRDQQVKIRGYRVELGEIETVIRQNENVHDAVVTIIDIPNGAQQLIGYVVPKEKECMAVLPEEISVEGYAKEPASVKWVDEEALKNELRVKLPDYMVPSSIITIEKIPLSANGKVDKKALPKPYIKKENTKSYIAPKNEMESILTSIWQEVLVLDKVSTNENFFTIGGDSLRAIQITAKAKQRNIIFSIADIYNYLTVEELAKHVMQSEAYNSPEENIISGITECAATLEEKELESGLLYEPFNLTDVQLAYIMGRDTQFELGGTSTHYYVELDTELQIERFNESLNKVIARHPMMRTIINLEGSQRILEHVPEYKIVIEDLTEFDAEMQEKRIVEERNRMSHHMFRTDEWPLFEFKAFKLQEGKYLLCIGIDILIVDGASIYIIGRELKEFYDKPQLWKEEIKYTFKDYITELQSFKKSETYRKDKAYWLDKLDDFPMSPDLPLKQSPRAVVKPHFSRVSKMFSKSKWDKIKKKAQEKNITPAALLCTAYCSILKFWSNQRHFAVDLTVFNRQLFNKDIDKIVGDFTSLILLDIDLPPKYTFWEKAKRVQQTLMEALEHRNYDGVEFIREIVRHNNMGTKAAMPVIFTCALFNDARDGWSQIGKMKYAQSQTPQVYLDNQIVDMNGELYIAWDYEDSLFDKDTIEQMFEQYICCISGVLEYENGYVPDINENDRKLIKSYNMSEENLPVTTLQGLFAEQIKKHPQKTAVIFEDQHISYEELNRKSNQVARYLKASGIEDNRIVGVSAKRSIGTIINMLGILKAGGAYVPVEPDYPEDRRKFILNNSGCTLLLEPDLYSCNEVLNYSGDDVEPISNTESVAYIIYTSGSTGRPKGVIIKHSAAVNTIIDINNKFNVTSDDKIIGLSSMCFDLSVYDIFGAVSTGATLVMVRDQRDVKDVLEIMDKHKITFWNSVPAIMDMVVENIDTDYTNESLKNVLLSGDWIPINLPQKIWKHFKNSKVTSLGGATEASIWSIHYPISVVMDSWRSIPYGYPLANQSFYILNDEGGLCPLGVPGELHIGGLGVAEGYINDKEKTENAFIDHPELGRLYKTGDHGVLMKEGYIEFLGRKDQQVKIRGYRIELGEIQTVMEQCPSVKEALVTVIKGSQGHDRLVGYVVPDTNKSGLEHHDDNELAGMQRKEEVFRNIEKAGCKQELEHPENLAPEKYLDIWKKIEFLSTAYMCNTIKKFNVFNSKNESYEFEELINICRIVPGYRKLFKQWLDVLAEDGLLFKAEETVYSCTSALPDNDVEKLWNELKESINNPELEVPLSYLALSSKNHAGMLRGEINALELFFPEGATETALSIYRFNPIAQYVNNIAASVLKAYVDSMEEGKQIKILELGAGTGGTTASLLPALSGKKVSYIFTDLSTFFTSEAKKRFIDYPFVEYGILDINDDPQQQGFALNSFDIVIGANVLHDAKNLNKSLNYIKSLLTPKQGILLFVEGTLNTRQQMVSVGFIEGFSHFEDERIKDNLPLLSTEKWESTIKSCGFDNFMFFPEKSYPTEVYNQHVMLAANSTEAKGMDLEEIKGHLGKLLPDYMIPSHFIQIEQIPLSANGKVDKKALPKPEEEQSNRNTYVAPSNEIQEIMAAVWKEVLEVDRVGIYDNFFDLGGDSLKAIKAVSKLGLYFDIDLNKFFNSGTIFTLSQGLTMKKEFLKDKLNKVIGGTIVDLSEQNQPQSVKDSLKEYRKKNEVYLNIDLLEKEPIKNVLLTGATGYLGIHMLHELLDNTGYNIYMLVRAKTKENAAKRVEEKYNYYFGDSLYSENSDRVHFINGNVTSERFDMPQTEYDELAQIIDSIIHCAAMVKHLGKYDDFYNMNVQGALKILEFAGYKKPKDINHISSTGVGAGVINNNETALFTEYDFDMGQTFQNNYLKSKFECERVLLDGRAQGLNVKFYRMGNLAFNSETGKFQSNIEENIGYLLVRAFLKLKMLPDIDIQYSDVTYIDYAAKAVCLLFDRKNLRNETYHIYNTKLVGFRDMWKEFGEYSSDLELYDLEKMADLIKNNYSNKELLPYIESLLFQTDVIAAMNDTRMIKTAEKSELILKALGFEWERPNGNHYKRALDYCKEVGFI